GSVNVDEDPDRVHGPWGRAASHQGGSRDLHEEGNGPEVRYDAETDDVHVRIQHTTGRHRFRGNARPVTELPVDLDRRLGPLVRRYEEQRHEEEADHDERDHVQLPSGRPHHASEARGPEAYSSDSREAVGEPVGPTHAVRESVRATQSVRETVGPPEAVREAIRTTEAVRQPVGRSQSVRTPVRSTRPCGRFWRA